MAEQVASPSMIETFKRKVREWWASVQKLKALQVPTNKQAEKNKLLSRAETIKNSIKSATNWSDTLRIDELGFLPLIPLAVIGSAVAAIGYWVTDYAKFSSSVQYQATLISQGVSPEKAALLANQQANPPSFFSSAGSLIKWGLVGAALFFAYKTFVKKA